MGGDVGEENVSADLSNFLPCMNVMLATFLSTAFYAVMLGRKSAFITFMVVITGVRSMLFFHNLARGITSIMK